MLDGLFSKAGTCPLPCPRPGVPLKVPPEADMTTRNNPRIMQPVLQTETGKIDLIGLIELLLTINSPATEPQTNVKSELSQNQRD